MTAAKRVEALERGAGMGRAVWMKAAQEGAQMVYEALEYAGTDTPTKRGAALGIVREFREAYRPGYTEAELEAAMDTFLDRCKDAFTAEEFAVLLAIGVHKQREATA